MKKLSKTDNLDYLLGRYDECRLLLTSVRFNRPQREVIEEQAYEIKARMEELGVRFLESAE